MINPRDVSLIIFDLDGTIAPSLEPVYEGIIRAFAKLGWPVRFRKADIAKYFGLPGGELYQFITPVEYRSQWPEVRGKIREELDATFRERAHTFPGVKETLTALRERDYRLALYSNSPVSYFNVLTESLQIRDYFDYLECIGENNLTKTQLVLKIRDQYGGLTMAVVGDRLSDIETARATGSLSIGVLFGYGQREPEWADITINTFHDLLNVFDKKPTPPLPAID